MSFNDLTAMGDVQKRLCLSETDAQSISSLLSSPSRGFIGGSDESNNCIIRLPPAEDQKIIISWSLSDHFTFLFNCYIALSTLDCAVRKPLKEQTHKSDTENDNPIQPDLDIHLGLLFSDLDII